MSDAWNTTELKQALPPRDGAPLNEDAAKQNGDPQGVSVPANGDRPSGEWVAPEAYDYTAMASNSESAPHWEGGARVYQWKDEFGEVGPKFPELEIELFGNPSERHERTGLDFARYV